MTPLSVAQLQQWLTDPDRPSPVLLDVREPWEVAIAALPGALLIPMNQIPARTNDFDDEKPVVCVCHHGARSLQVAMFLERQGVTSVYNLTGGIDAWSTLIDPSIARY